VALAALCAVVALAAVWQAAGDAATIDEPVYVTAGVTALRRHDLRLNPQHPPLAKVLAALPVLAAHPAMPGGAVWQRHHHRVYAKAFLKASRRSGNLREITFLSRLVPILELLATGIVVYVLARRLAGPVGGVFAAALWLLDPFVLGLGHLDDIDLPFTLAALVFALALVRWLECRTLARAALVGLACGAALVIRDTGPLLLIVAVITVAVVSRDIRPALAVGGSAFAVVWLVYLLLDPAFTMSHLNVLPQRYVSGFDALADAHPGPQAAFLIGRHWRNAHWWLWPLSMAIKLPVTLLVAYALAPFFRRKAPGGDRRRVYGALIPAALALAAFTMLTPVYLGLRYMLPVFGLLTVSVAPLIRGPRALPVLLVAGSAAFTAASLPHSIAWTAPPFHPAYRYVTDWNLDLGQDVYPLQRWARGKRPWMACYSPRGGGCITDVPGARRLRKHASPRNIHGWVAMSSTLLNLDGWDPWLSRLRPVGTIDGTVLLYRVAGSPLAKSRARPPPNDLRSGAVQAVKRKMRSTASSTVWR
jgi:hypothetical protein